MLGIYIVAIESWQIAYYCGFLPNIKYSSQYRILKIIKVVFLNILCLEVSFSQILLQSAIRLYHDRISANFQRNKIHRSCKSTKSTKFVALEKICCMVMCVQLM